MGKVEAGKLEVEWQPMRLTEVLADAELFALAAEKKGLSFLQEIPDTLYAGVLAGDRLKLRQILANFLSNAVKFTARGSITLRVRQEEGTNPSQLVITLEVEDTGVGITEATQKHLFTPFQCVIRLTFENVRRGC